MITLSWEGISPRQGVINTLRVHGLRFLIPQRKNGQQWEPVSSMYNPFYDALILIAQGTFLKASKIATSSSLLGLCMHFFCWELTAFMTHSTGTRIRTPGMRGMHFYFWAINCIHEFDRILHPQPYNFFIGPDATQYQGVASENAMR